MVDSKTKSKRDIVLLVILGLFNVWSGATTIIGASYILPIGWSWMSGFAVQFMLFALLSGWAMRDSFFRKWLAVLAFSTISVYTSFFCYYDILTQDARKVSESIEAQAAHQSLIANVFIPLENELRTLEAEVGTAYRIAKEECDGLITGLQGCGEKHRELLKEAIAKDELLKKQASLVSSIRDKFYYDTDQLSPQQIYERDLEALASVPSELKTIDTIAYSSYFDEDYSVEFLTPYYKVFKSESRQEPAVVALVIAALIDGIAIMQGTAIERRKRKYSFIQLLTIKVQDIIDDSHDFLNVIRGNRLTEPRDRINSAFLEEECLEGLSAIVNDIHKICSLGHIFINGFMNSIHQKAPHIIEIQDLLLTRKESHLFIPGYKKVIELLKDNRIATDKGEKLCLSEKNYLLIYDWATSEMYKYYSPEGFVRNKDLERDDIPIRKFNDDLDDDQVSWSDTINLYNKKQKNDPI